MLSISMFLLLLVYFPASCSIGLVFIGSMIILPASAVIFAFPAFVMPKTLLIARGIWI